MQGTNKLEVFKVAIPKSFDKTASYKISVEDSSVLVGFYDVNKAEVIGNIFEKVAE